MARLFTRVELHDAEESDYQSLHAEMETAGFSRTIPNISDVLYHLPPAEYTVKSDSMTTEHVGMRVIQAAAITNRRFAAVFVEVKNISWFGLELVKSEK